MERREHEQATERCSPWQKVIKHLDRFGNTAHCDPRRQPKSVLGAIVTFLSFAICATLFITSVVQFVGQEQTIRVGGRAQLNSLYRYWSGTEPGDEPRVQTWPNLFVPSLELKFQSKVFFFQRQTDTRSIFKVEVRDHNGYHSTFTSDESPTPVGFAVHSTHQVPLNSFDDRVNKATKPQHPGIKFKLQDAIYFSKVIRSLESLQIIRSLNDADAAATSAFTDHTATLLVRFDAAELKKLKACQLQVLLYNEGQFGALADNGLILDRQYHSKAIFSAQNSDAVTWDPAGFLNGQFRYSISLARSALSFNQSMFQDFVGTEWIPGVRFEEDRSHVPEEYMDWGYVINYVNNFNYTFTAPTCDNTLRAFNTAFVDGLELSRLTPSSLNLPAAKAWPVPPFSILVSSQGVLERMLVTDVRSTPAGDSNSSEQVLVLNRTADSLDRSSIVSDPRALATDPRNQSGSWVCPIEWYEDGRCHCECGGVDIDCVTGNALAETGCEGRAAFGSFCSLQGRCTQDHSTSLTVSEGCAPASLHLPGETAVVGMQGDPGPTDSSDGGLGACRPCPDDRIFGGLPRRYGPDGALVCHPPVPMTIPSDLNNQDLHEGWGEIRFESGIGNASSSSSSSSSSGPIVQLRGFTMPGLGFPDIGIDSDQVGDQAQAVLAGPLFASVKVGEMFNEQVQVRRSRMAGYGLAGIHLAPLSPSPPLGSLLFHAQRLLFSRSQDRRSCRFGVVAELVSPIAPTSWSFTVMLPINFNATHRRALELGYYFPRVDQRRDGSGMGEYEVNVRGRTLRITQASRMREVRWTGEPRFVQTLMISEPPRFSTGASSFVTADAPVGSTEIRIRDPELIAVGASSDFAAACAGKQYCVQPAVHLEIGPHGHQVYVVRRMLGSVLTLETPLTAPVGEGDPFYTTFTPRPADRVRYFGCDDRYNTYVYAQYELELTQDSTPYPPSERYKATVAEPTTSPQVLQVETALFVSLESNASRRDLCPDIKSKDQPSVAQRFQVQGWDQWRYYRDAAVGACQTLDDAQDVCASAKEEAIPGKDVCQDVMPPTAVSSFEYYFPVNNKWVTKFRVYDRNTINDQEYLVDVVYEYHFNYDASIKQTDHAFSQGQPTYGDMYFSAADNRTRTTFFAGGPMFMGRPASKGFQHHMGDLLAASSPVLSNQVTLQVAPHAFDDLVTVQRNGGGSNWPGDAEEAKQLLETFPPLSIEFDLESLDGQSPDMRGLLLQPGHEYKFEAFLSIEPLLSSANRVLGWTTRVVRKRAFSAPLGLDEASHVARVRYSISLDPTTMSSIRSTSYSFTAAATDVGLSFLYFFIGLAALTVGRRILHWGVYLPSNNTAPPPRLQQLEARVKALKQD